MTTTIVLGPTQLAFPYRVHGTQLKFMQHTELNPIGCDRPAMK